LVSNDEGTLISRAHGFDLYHERHDPPYIPCQAATLRGLQALFLACSHARDYIVDRFPGAVPRCEVYSLGVPSPAAAPRNAGSLDGVLRIVSCSGLVPVKRIDLLIRGIAEAARLRPGQRVEWTHLGGGPEAESLGRLAHDVLPTNVTWAWHGEVENERVLAFYRSNPVDVFATTSGSEGGVPVAIMEAQSHGIPVVATSVGGISDIVSPANGIGLRPTASPEEIGQALLTFAERSAETEAMRAASARICAERFDADVNSLRFADRLISLISERSNRALPAAEGTG
jgi:glycosyltransferase involved in cell wall biosynthesis